MTEPEVIEEEIEETETDADRIVDATDRIVDALKGLRTTLAWIAWWLFIIAMRLLENLVGGTNP